MKYPRLRRGIFICAGQGAFKGVRGPLFSGAGERGKGIVRLLCKKENFPLEFQRNTEGEFWKNPFPFLERGL